MNGNEGEPIRDIRIGPRGIKYITRLSNPSSDVNTMLEEETDLQGTVLIQRRVDKFLDGLPMRRIGFFTTSSGEKVSLCYIEDRFQGFSRSVSLEKEGLLMTLNFPGNGLDSLFGAVYEPDTGKFKKVQYYFSTPEQEIVTVVAEPNAEDNRVNYNISRHIPGGDDSLEDQQEREMGRYLRYSNLFSMRIRGILSGYFVVDIEQLMRRNYPLIDPFYRKSHILPGFSIFFASIFLPLQINPAEFKQIAENSGWEDAPNLIPMQITPSR